MLEIRLSGLPEAQARIKAALSPKVRLEIASALLDGSREFGAAVKVNQMQAGQMFENPTGKLAASGKSWGKIRDWGALAGYSFDATSGRKRARYGYILQAGVNTNREPPMYSQGPGRKKRRRKDYKRGNFVIAPRPFIAREMATTGPRIEAKVRGKIIRSMLGGLDG